MFIAFGLNGRTRDLYSGMSSGDCVFGELGPNANVKYVTRSSSTSSLNLRPSIITSRIYVTRARQLFSSQVSTAMRFWNEWHDWKQVVNSSSLWLRSWLLVLGSSCRP